MGIHFTSQYYLKLTAQQYFMLPKSNQKNLGNPSRVCTTGPLEASVPGLALPTLTQLDSTKKRVKHAGKYGRQYKNVRTLAQQRCPWPIYVQKRAKGKGVVKKPHFWACDLLVLFWRWLQTQADFKEFDSIKFLKKFRWRPYLGAGCVKIFGGV